MPDQEGAMAGRAQLRKAAEQLYEDSRLRDALTDEEAERLLSWAYGRLEQAVERAEAMPEEEAMPLLDERSDAVKAIVRRVNAIMDEFSQPAEGENRRSLASLTEVLDEAGERMAPEEASLEMELMAERSGELDRETLFQRLMDVITVEEEAE